MLNKFFRTLFFIGCLSLELLPWMQSAIYCCEFDTVTDELYREDLRLMNALREESRAWQCESLKIDPSKQYETEGIGSNRLTREAGVTLSRVVSRFGRDIYKLREQWDRELKTHGMKMEPHDVSPKGLVPLSFLIIKMLESKEADPEFLLDGLERRVNEVDMRTREAWVRAMEDKTRGRKPISTESSPKQMGMPDGSECKIENPLHSAISKEEREMRAKESIARVLGPQLANLASLMDEINQERELEKAAYMAKQIPPKQESMEKEKHEEIKDIGILKHTFNTITVTACGGLIGAVNNVKDRDNCCAYICFPCVCGISGAFGALCGPIWCICGPCTDQSSRRDLNDNVHCDNPLEPLLKLMLDLPGCSCC